MQLPLRVALVITIILIAGAGATPASAGVYAVYACDPAHGNVNNSWQVAVQPPRHPRLRRLHAPPRLTRPLGPGSRHPGDGEPQGQASHDPTTAPPPAGSSAPLQERSSRMSASSARYCGTVGHDWRCSRPTSSRCIGGTTRTGVACCSTAPERPPPLCSERPPSLRTCCAEVHARRRRNRHAHGRACARSRSTCSTPRSPSISVTGGSGVAPGWKRGGRDVPVRHERQRGHSSRIDRSAAASCSVSTTRHATHTRAVPCPMDEQHRRREHADRCRMGCNRS